MRRLLLIVLVRGSVIVAADPAAAHRPYFTQAERIVLPNGDVGEVRLLHGDGILGSDPARALVLDAQGRLVARSPKSVSLVLSCGSNRQCLVIDLEHDKVFEPEQSSFRQGIRVPGLSDEERNELWDLEDGEESWGFTIRDTRGGERFAGNVAMAREVPLSLAILAVLGFVAAGAPLPFSSLPGGTSPAARAFLRGLGLASGFVVSFGTVALAVWFTVVGGLSPELGLISFGSGLLVPLLIARQIRKSRRRTRLV